ncbi:GNAT family N-acetyltransferase [Nocardioides sp. J2M5]|uniref:GNAT family N-acetyltransferase n=1 Tax=Nocardioides palaemonis TaxID=2829810 RepID=UPI001BACA528|nr:GNAT family N-acetyltransferase [Nocardioides palaemonis]MBS2939184.1 GNAT family N-acetyltransferase [Nocardioides palaemonis]
MIRSATVTCDRPTSSDDPALHAVFEGLSDRSRFLRFHTGVPHYPRAWWEVLARVEQGRSDVALARVSGRPVGHGQWHRVDATTAELSLAVVDAWQRQGVGSVLVDHLARTASLAGIERFRSWVHPDNAGVRAMLRDREAYAGPDGSWTVAVPAQQVLRRSGPAAGEAA